MKFLRRFRRDQRGVVYWLVVMILALISCSFFWYVMALTVQQVQEGVGEHLTQDKWADEGVWNSFDLANTFMNNLWIYFLVFLVLGLMYCGYMEAQRRGRAY